MSQRPAGGAAGDASAATTVLDTATVRRAARLARIAVRDDELPGLADELERVRVFVDALQGVDVDHIAPLVHPNHDAMPLRPDRVPTSADAGALTQDQALANAPATRDAHFAVPRVVG